MSGRVPTSYSSAAVQGGPPACWGESRMSARLEEQPRRCHWNRSPSAPRDASPGHDAGVGPAVHLTGEQQSMAPQAIFHCRLQSILQSSTVVSQASTGIPRPESVPTAGRVPPAPPERRKDASVETQAWTAPPHTCEQLPSQNKRAAPIIPAQVPGVQALLHAHCSCQLSAV